MIHLTKRLAAAASLVPPGARLADIGTDHGFVPVVLCQEGICPQAIAADVAAGPLSAARQHVRKAGLAARIECRLSDGLTAVRPGEIDGAMFCGMGGPLMERLLKQSPEVTASLQFLVLQPQSEAAHVRRSLYEMGWHIEDERLVWEDGRLYELMRAVPGRQTVPADWLLDTGPVNWRRHDSLLPQLLQGLIDKDQRIRQGLLHSRSDQSSRIRTLNQHLNTLEGLLCQYHLAKL